MLFCSFLTFLSLQANIHSDVIFFCSKTKIQINVLFSTRKFIAKIERYYYFKTSNRRHFVHFYFYKQQFIRIFPIHIVCVIFFEIFVHKNKNLKKCNDRTRGKMFSKVITIAFCSYLCLQTKLDSELMIFVSKNF